MRNITILSENNCTGCSACATLCPRKCIEMKLNEEQFHYPQVDQDRCIDCGICIKNCPAYTPIEKHDYLAAYAATGKDKAAVENSSSGGAFFLLAKYVVEILGGYVCGAILEDGFKLKHKVVNKMEDVKKMQGSKYIQSDIGMCYEEIICLLKKENYVLFCGTPCQVAGLRSVVKYGRDFLFTLDLICHGVPSAYAFSDSMKKMYGDEKYIGFSFRQRSKYLLTSYSYFYKKKKNLKNKWVEKRIFAYEDPFYWAFIEGVNYRESCYNCIYASDRRCGDITIGDCANSNSYKRLLGRSLSSVIINTNNGKKLWDNVKEQFEYEIADYEKEVRLNKQLHEAVKRPEKRTDFYSDLRNMEAKFFKKKYCPKRSFKEKVKHFVIWHIPVSTRIKMKKILRRI